MIDKIIAPVVSLGGLGLLFGAVLAYASQKFAVEVDERVEKIMEILPSANCGACGYAGCGGYAAAVVEGKAPINGCPVGAAGVSDEVAKIMGVKAEINSVKNIARVMCNGTCDKAKEKYEYIGVVDCLAASKLGGGSKGCSYGCLGLATCVKACLFDAITIKNGIAVVNKDKCTSCGRCISACPKKIIEFVPENQDTWVMCMSKDKGKDTKAVCTTGCIACKICEKACEYDAINVVNNIATIDYDKCVNCNQCVLKCPQKIIRGKV